MTYKASTMLMRKLRLTEWRTRTEIKIQNIQGSGIFAWGHRMRSRIHNRMVFLSQTSLKCKIFSAFMMVTPCTLYSTCEKVLSTTLATSTYSDLLTDTILQLRPVSHYPAISLRVNSITFLMFNIILSVALNHFLRIPPCPPEDWKPPSSISWPSKTWFQPPAWRPGSILSHWLSDIKSFLF